MAMRWLPAYQGARSGESLLGVKWLAACRHYLLGLHPRLPPFDRTTNGRTVLEKTENVASLLYLIRRGQHAHRRPIRYIKNATFSVPQKRRTHSQAPPFKIALS
jgi:hypothetical protein